MAISKSSKTWGYTEHLMTKNAFEVHRIVAHKGHQCSLHSHENKYNMFYVESGKMLVEVHNADSGIVDKTILKKGDTLIVPPGKLHRFVPLSCNMVAYEFYWVPLENYETTVTIPRIELQMSGDIIRKEAGE